VPDYSEIFVDYVAMKVDAFSKGFMENPGKILEVLFTEWLIHINASIEESTLATPRPQDLDTACTTAPGMLTVDIFSYHAAICQGELVSRLSNCMHAGALV